MSSKFPSNSESTKSSDVSIKQQNKIESIIKYGETKIKQINKRILENEVRLESMESHSDYEYKDLLKESNEAGREHREDLRLFLDLLANYKVVIR